MMPALPSCSENMKYSEQCWAQGSLGSITTMKGLESLSFVNEETGTAQLGGMAEFDPCL